MSQSLADIVLHLVFSTKDRHPWIHSSIEEELFMYISGLSKQLNCPVIKINGMEDHIHILLHLGKTISFSDLISELKSNSSRWIKAQGKEYDQFYWQRGYGIFSVSRPNIETAAAYISRQKEHHKTISFKDEFLSMLKRSQMTYDETYLWD